MSPQRMAFVHVGLDDGSGDFVDALPRFEVHVTVTARAPAPTLCPADRATTSVRCWRPGAAQ